MEKIIKERGDYILSDGTKGLYEFYEDGSASANCVVCGKVDLITAERAGKFIVNSPNWYKTYSCFDCWRANKDNDKNDRISFAQAYNLAVASLSEEDKENLSEIQFKLKVRERQKFFYQELKGQNTIDIVLSVEKN